MRQIPLFLVICFCISTFADPNAAKPSVDFKQLGQTCETSWGRYLSQLRILGAQAHEWVMGLDQRQVETLYDADDQLMIFISAFFPSELHGKITGDEESFLRCYGMNYNLQRDMNDRSRPHIDDVKRWANCMKQRYTGGISLMAPLNLSVACYEKQATQFKE